MANDTLLELQSQRDALKENLQDVDQSIRKLTGRDPVESRRLSTSRRFQLKRNLVGNASGNQPPEKRAVNERRRWGKTALPRANNLDSGGEEEEEEKKKPSVHSSVVATGKPIEAPKRPVVEDKAVKSRNKRMLGMLMGHLNQFKRESQYKSEQDVKREEKLTKVEEQVEKDKEDAMNERKQLFQTRRTKQDELRKLEFKIEMTELNVELKSHYEQFKDFIQLKSTPRIFYKPAKHNDKTLKLLKVSQEMLKDSLEQRLKEIEMCTEEDIAALTKQHVSARRESVRLSDNVVVTEPVANSQASKRDLFAEDAEIDLREREAEAEKVGESENKPKTILKSITKGIDQKEHSTIDDTSESPNTKPKSRSRERDSISKKLDIPSQNQELDQSKTITMNDNIDGVVKVVLNNDLEKSVVDSEELVDSRRVVSDQAGYDVMDERVIKVNNKSMTDEENDEVNNKSEDDINIYEDMQRDIELFQADAEIS